MEQTLEKLRARFESSIIIQNLLRSGKHTDVEKLWIAYQLDELARNEKPKRIR
jgi:hypothetical protein